ncbi:glycosyltransferase family 2 protein [Pelagibius sp.]|uniref:glycosyltransferase family 2 protein n=1 Tax=Pelagibius sp. TaxID=1931238 RepID=UPI003BAFD802
MTDFPLVSVIIPNFNRKAELQRAVDSVLSQDYEELEIIVVDDASTVDVSLSFPPLEPEKLRWITLPENRGGATARNAGIDAARGELVAFLDSDDVWTSDKLTRQVANYLADGRPADCVYYSQVVMDRGEERLLLPERPMAPDEGVGDYLFPWRGNLIHTSSLLMSASLARAVRFTDDLRIHQDVDFCLRLQQQGARFRFHPEPLSRWHAEARADRMSYRPKFLLSLNWLATTGELMPFHSRQKFATQLASRMPAFIWSDPGVVLRGIWRCRREGYISTRYALRLLTQFVMPARWSNGIARALKPARQAGGG